MPFARGRSGWRARKIRRAPSQHCRGAGVYALNDNGLVHEMHTPLPLPPSLCTAPKREAESKRPNPQKQQKRTHTCWDNSHQFLPFPPTRVVQTSIRYYGAFAPCRRGTLVAPSSAAPPRPPPFPRPLSRTLAVPR